MEEVFFMANAKFLLQGNSVKGNHKNLFNQLRNITGKLLIATAFLRSEGVILLKELLKQSNSKIEMYVGIRNGVTSKQGLEELLELEIYPYVIDTGANNFIFHPKVILAYDELKAISIVGSANLTLGGLVNNIEASTILELDMTQEGDKNYVVSLETAFSNLTVEENKENITQITQIEDILKLYDEGKIIDESIISHRFIGNTVKNCRVTPRMHVHTEKVKEINNKKKSGIQKVSVNQERELVNTSWIKVWESKPLKERDLNIPTGANTHATGSMTLKKGMYEDIDQRIYFRKSVFNELEWEHRKKGASHLEYATGEFFIVIEGINYGKYFLELKHDPRTDTKSYLQNNAMTHLLWKEAKELIANRNLLGKRLELYKLKDSNEFVINIDE